MTREYMNISEGQYLSDTEEFKNGTPTNYIIFKKLPGLGATHGECLKYNRNSIIIEPNVPVLEGKRDATYANGDRIYPNILVVYKTTSVLKIKEYLASSITPKKILSTPEGFQKVKKAVYDSSFNLYKDFFMLFDECDRLIKDVDYRDNILLPMKDFFKFQKKAIISATAIEPSDERFEQQEFKILEVMPDYDYKKDIELIETNNILFSLEKQFSENKDGQFFIFINSAKLIHVLIQRLKIEKDSKIYCAYKSVKNLEKDHFENATPKLGDFAKFNFLTSRNFGAVDIKLDEKPHVVMVTDTLRKAFTMLDPFTDSIQIIGRFRNGVASATHISNFDENLEWKTRETALEFIEDSYNCYLMLDVVRDLNSLTEGGAKTGEQALEGTQINSFVDDELKLNKYMVDNYLLDQVIKSNYTESEKLLEAYEKTGSFNVSTKKLWFSENDGQLLVLEKEKNSPEAIEIVAKMLFRACFPLKNKDFLLFPDDKLVRKMAPEIAKIFDTIGFLDMQDLEFDIVKMNKRCGKVQEKLKYKNPALIAEVQALYTTTDKPTIEEAKSALQVIYTKYEIQKKVKGQDFKKFYNAKETTITGNIKAWKILGLKI
ncbi:hypothetical protein [Pedobacter frigiditerrae]|uniref:hypothetical protein n=1 Tax=Pedobacter frigiditerrae TaxID=2530452 RepID=UPI00292EA522|nr:hypothetical protein [Pedobacter frigiditerrae]